MKTPGIVFLAAALLLASCASTSFYSPEPYAVPDDFFGISPDRSPLEEEDYAILDEFGAVWIRTTASWSGIERQEGVWDFSNWDNYVDKAKAAGKKVIFILGFDNSWLYKNGKEKRDFTEREIPYFLEYVERIVIRYKGRVDAFEIWNEPNFFFWKGSDKHFFALSAAAAKKIRETDPEAVILAGSTFRVDSGFIRGLFKAGAMEYTNGISVHPYASNALNTVKQIDKLRKILAQFNYPGEIWVTEVGYSTRGIYFSSNNLKTYPEYIVKTMSGLAARGTRNLIWYELLDEFNKDTPPDTWNPSHFFGLIYPDRTRKEGAAAFALCANYLRGAEYRPEAPERLTVPDSVTSFYFGRESDGANTLILWSNSGKKKVRLALPSSGAISHSIRGGEAAALPSDSVLTLTKDPLFITWTGTRQGLHLSGE
jgi:hypothetical protein